MHWSWWNTWGKLCFKFWSLLLHEVSKVKPRYSGLVCKQQIVHYFKDSTISNHFEYWKLRHINLKRRKKPYNCIWCNKKVVYLSTKKMVSAVFCSISRKSTISRSTISRLHCKFFEKWKRKERKDFFRKDKYLLCDMIFGYRQDEAPWLLQNANLTSFSQSFLSQCILRIYKWKYKPVNAT